jgi:hypothetical protein
MKKKHRSKGHEADVSARIAGGGSQDLVCANSRVTAHVLGVTLTKPLPPESKTPNTICGIYSAVAHAVVRPNLPPPLSVLPGERR